MQKVRDIFYNQYNPAFLENAKRVRFQLPINERKYYTKKKISEWIKQQDVTTLHKQQLPRITGNHYKVNSIDDLWEMDLCNMQSFADSNDGNKHILTVIDVFSKYAFAKPVKNKTALDIFRAFKAIVEESRRSPRALQSDMGLEFKNNIFKNYCKAHNIQQNYPQLQSLHKCAVIERFNRTLKNKIFHYFTIKGRNYRRYVDILPTLIHRYNNTVHSTIKKAPSQVKRKHTAEIYYNIKRSQQKNNKKKEVEDELYVNDFVRIIRKKNPLEHAYTEKWTREVFQVSQVIDATPFKLYKLTDLTGRQIDGKFYFNQLQKISIEKNRPIKIIKSRGLGPTLEHYVETADKKHFWLSHKKYNETKI